MSDTLRFIARSAILLCGISLAMGAAYVVIKLSFFTVNWLDRVWFAEPW